MDSRQVLSSAPRYPAIADYGFLSDCHSWALVSRHGSVDWLCFYEAGRRTTFARILDWDGGGYLRVAPISGGPSSRRYLPGTNVLETTWETDGGRLVVTDALTVSDEEGSPGSGVRPHHELLRRVECTAGRVEVGVELAPRFDYGLTTPHVEVHDQGAVVVIGGRDALAVRSGVALESAGWHTACGRRQLEVGEHTFVSVNYHRSHQLTAPPALDGMDERLEETLEFWQGWSDDLDYDGAYDDAVIRSALVLKGLTDAASGAIVAAPTTSLPEAIGGVRNWDYRFTWIRDATLHLNALFGLGSTAEAHDFMGFLRRTTAGTAEDLQVLYDPSGGRVVQEMTLTRLEGYRQSSPVHIGNGAASQFQLDLYGELLNTAWHYVGHGGSLKRDLKRLLADTVEVIEESWLEADRGLWEVRGSSRHFVSSKLYAWVGADRATRLAAEGHLDIDVERCKRLRERIRRRIERDGTDPDEGYFLREFGGRGLDASTLLIPLEGFLPADDPRVEATVEAVFDELTTDELVHRYHHADGLPGQLEGGFVLCSCWLVSCLADRGEHERARELFEALLGRTNDLGLLSEEVRPEDGTLLGNFPQAISHAGVVNTALHLSGDGGPWRRAGT